MLWTADLFYPLPTLSRADSSALAEALGEDAVIAHHDDTGELQIIIDITADTIGDAATTALRTVTEATALGDPSRLELQSASDYLQARNSPPPQDLVGLLEIAEFLGFSRQRASKLAASDPDFPPPVATLAATRVYTLDSIIAFDERRTGRSWRHHGPAVLKTD